MDRIARTIAAEINARPDQVGAAVKLLDEGATVPFVARYRKEATGGLDDSQLRTLSERLDYLRELEPVQPVRQYVAWFLETLEEIQFVYE